MSDKPPQHTAEHAAQFADATIVAAYATRPPYPDEVFEIIESLLPPGDRRVLELGCGSGDLTLGLAPRVSALDAVDISAPMLELARKRLGARHANVTWFHTAVESFALAASYSAIVAGESLHWMDWEVVLPRCARWLDRDGVLAIADGRTLDSVPWRDELMALIRTHSTTPEFRAYGLGEELAHRGLFRELGQRRTKPVAFEQSVDDYVESFHSRNGFSRERMTPHSAAEFDRALRAAVLRHCPDGVVRAANSVRVVWGRPLSGEDPAGRR